MLFSMKMAKRNFFDRKRFRDPIQHAKAQILSKFGAAVRAIAKSMIKIQPDGVHSAPGAPPYSHEPNSYWHIRYVDTIFFVYDKNLDNVIIGALLVNKSHRTPVPKALEYGGEVALPYFENGRRKKKLVYQEPRPHMRKAFKIVVDRMLPSLILFSIVPTGSGEG